MKRKFDVKGMTCSACSLGIEKNVGKLDGVESVAVSLMDESMSVEYDEKIVDDDAICRAVDKLGYKATVYGKHNKDKISTADKLRTRFFASLALLLPLMYFSMGGMVGLPLPSDTVNFSIQFVLTSIVLALNYQFFTNGSRAVWHRAPNMDTLVALGAAASYIFSVVTMSMFFAGALLPKHLFFESAAMVVTLVTLGKWLEEKSKKRTGKEIEKLSKLIPNTATVLKDGKEIIVESNTLENGDTLVFRTGDYICVDGEVKNGSAFADKAALTGESLPVEVSTGDRVESGSIVKSGYITVIAQRTGDDTLFAQIIERVRSAGASKAPVQKFADKVAGVFVPIVSAIALVTFVAWLFARGDVYDAFNFGISVLVISCPCALGLATPVAVMAASGKAASLGILYKDAEALQKSPEINCVLLDKTATITEGQPHVVEAKILAGDEKNVKAVASAIEKMSNHPLAECVKEFCGETDLECENYVYTIGKGASATVRGKAYRLGNRALMGEQFEVQCTRLEKETSDIGATAVFLADEESIVAVFEIADKIKDDSKQAIAALHELKIETVMITGDNAYAAAAVAKEAGIEEFEAEVLPNGKAEKVQQFRDKGLKVAMVGDGINDSPALKTADVGIAIGTGTDVAIDSADIVLVGGSLKGLGDVVKLGKKAVGIIKGNLFWAFFYNVIAIPVAAGAFAVLGVSLTPSIAAACMSISSLFVVLNALRISAYRSGWDNKNTAIKKTDEKGARGIGTSENGSISDTINDKYENEGQNVAKGEVNMEIKTVVVEGMMCGHCVQHVTSALQKVEGVKNVNVDLESKKARVECEKGVSSDALKAAVEDAGYEVSEILN